MSLVRGLGGYTKILVIGLIGILLTSCANNSSRSGSSVEQPGGTATNKTLICHAAHQYAGKVVGDGHCVSLIKQCSDAPNTVDWRPGKQVLKQPAGAISPGTIIATFENGRYPSRSGYHAAIYISHNQYGIWVWDQWLGMPVHKRLIRTRNDKANPSNSAQNYNIVRPTSR